MPTRLRAPGIVSKSRSRPSYFSLLSWRESVSNVSLVCVSMPSSVEASVNVVNSSGSEVNARVRIRVNQLPPCGSFRQQPGLAGSPHRLFEFWFCPSNGETLAADHGKVHEI